MPSKNHANNDRESCREFNNKFYTDEKGWYKIELVVWSVAKKKVFLSFFNEKIHLFEL